MSLRILSQHQNQLPHLFSILLLGFGYFGYPIIVEVISIFFQISSLTGKVLVNKFLAVFNCTLEIIRLACLFFQVLYEDSLIFLKDATDKFKFVVFLLQQIYFFVETFGWNFINGLLRLGEIISNILAFFYYTVVTFKEGIQLLGLSIWNFFTTLPDQLIFKIYGFNEFMLNTVHEFANLFFKAENKIFESLERTYCLLFDIQLDSVYGLFIGAVLLTIFCVKFKDICFITTSAFLKLYQQIASFAISLWSGRFLEQTSRSVDDSFQDDERLCIVCQYKLKEVIIFPCKHLCLCEGCSLQLTCNRPLCPLCRGNITGTLKVYL